MCESFGVSVSSMKQSKQRGSTEKLFDSNGVEFLRTDFSLCYTYLPEKILARLLENASSICRCKQWWQWDSVGGSEVASFYPREHLTISTARTASAVGRMFGRKTSLSSVAKTMTNHNLTHPKMNLSRVMQVCAGAESPMPLGGVSLIL